MDGAIDAGTPRATGGWPRDDGVHPLRHGDVAARRLQQWRHRVGYPAVVDPEEAGTNLSSDVVCVGAAWLWFSPQFEKVTTP